MTVEIPESREQFIRSMVKDGRYGSESEVVDEALRLFEEKALQRALDKKHLETLLLEGLNSGPATPMTSQDWDEIEQDGLRISAARKNRDSR